MEKLFNKSQKRLGISSRSVREGGERVVNRGEDLISLLPEPLLRHILSFLTTEQAVWTSVLSSTWRHLWRWVPRLELVSSDFTNVKVCVDFVDKFLAFQGNSYLRDFKLTIDHDVFDCDASLYEPCLGRVDMRKLERFQVENKFASGGLVYIATPLTLSVCESLVSLKLHFVRLNEFVSLSMPCLKIMFLENVVLLSDSAAEQLISSSPVLEVLNICFSKDDFLVALRVCSLSLKSLTLRQVYVRRRSVVIDAPKLKYLSLLDYYGLESFEIISMAEFVKVDLDFEFVMTTSDYFSSMKILYNLLHNFSRVGDMTMSWRTLQFIYCSYHKDPLPKFHGLTRLHVTMCLHSSPILLPIVLESCPNLKHLTLELFHDFFWGRLSEFSTVLPRCLVSSLESVKMESPVTGMAAELSLARYFMENSRKLEKLVLRLNQSSTGEKHKPGALEQLIESPRRSSLCQFKFINSSHQTDPLPKFHGLTRLRATMCLDASPELLPTILESCPSLKHLTLELVIYSPYPKSTRLSTVLPRCLVTSFESVEMESPVTETATELKLARYFMENSTTLKKLVLRLIQSFTGEKHMPGVLEQLIDSPRRSSLYQVEVMPEVLTPNPWPEWGVHVKSNRF